MLRILFFIATLTLSAPANSQELIGEYLAWLGPEDTVNSRGQRLTSFGAILAQDRANFHRFGIRHDLDTSDPVFADRRLRAEIPRFYRAGRRVEQYILDDVLSGRGHYVYVAIFGVNGRVTYINVFEGAG